MLRCLGHAELTEVDMTVALSLIPLPEDEKPKIIRASVRIPPLNSEAKSK